MSFDSAVTPAVLQPHSGESSKIPKLTNWGQCGGLAQCVAKWNVVKEVLGLTEKLHEPAVVGSAVL